MKRDDLQLVLPGPFTVLADFRCGRARTDGRNCRRLVGALVSHKGQLVVVTWRQPTTTRRVHVPERLQRYYANQHGTAPEPVPPRRRDAFPLVLDEAPNGVGLTCDHHGALSVVDRASLLDLAERARRTNHPEAVSIR